MSLTVERRFSMAGVLVLLVGAALPVLDVVLLNVALPIVAAELATDGPLLSLLVAGPALAAAALLIPGTRLGERYGARRILVIGLACFAAGAALCWFTADLALPALLPARLAQGAAIGLILPQISRPERGAASGIAAAIGLLLGGVLLHWRPDWRLLFLVEVPLAVVLLIAVWMLPPGPRSAGRGKVVRWSTVPVWAGIGGFLYVFPLTVQNQLGYGPSHSGLALVPGALCFFLGCVVGARGVRPGLLIVVVGLLGVLPAVELHAPLWALYPGMALVGFGMAFVVGDSAVTAVHHAALGLGVLVLGGGLGRLDHGFALVVTVALLLAAGSAALPAAPSDQAG
ncbi:MFS transporter [Pseudonocardiaceae bacterium YIM PH 21723]|nr:MFS transporter [Pseudonocardiaceae bacterium YIM PH 21723]